MNTLLSIYVVFRVSERDEDGNPTYVEDIEHFNSKEEAMTSFNQLKYKKIGEHLFSDDNIKILSLESFVDKFHITGEVRKK